MRNWMDTYNVFVFFFWKPFCHRGGGPFCHRGGGGGEGGEGPSNYVTRECL